MRARALKKLADPVKSAAAAGLRYVSDASPGIKRIRHGTGFRYFDPHGKPVRDPLVLARIKSLVIPPAWTDVWICPYENGHIQAVGLDARQRKQYLYHPDWRRVRDEVKFGQMLAFANALPKIRRRIKRDLALPGLPREKVLAAVVKLLEMTHIRVGNDEYAKKNQSFGLTTMRDRHASVSGSRINFSFQGKSGIHHEIELHDPVLAKIVRSCQELPGQELFQYVDENGEVRDVYSQDVNEYLQEITGEKFTAKDFRTWAGTLLAARALQELSDFESATAAKRNITQAIRKVSTELGNTLAVCRKCYVHPAVIDSYLDRSLLIKLKQAVQAAKQTLIKLSAEEVAICELLAQFGRRKSA